MRPRGRWSGFPVETGPGTGRVVVEGKPEHRLDAGQGRLEAELPREVAVAVGPDDLVDGRPDVAVELVGAVEERGQPPAVVDLTDRQHARAHVVELVAEAEGVLVGDPLAQPLDDDGELAQRAAERRQVRVAVGGPEADAVRPGRGGAIPGDAGDCPAGRADLAEDPGHVVGAGFVRLQRRWVPPAKLQSHEATVTVGSDIRAALTACPLVRANIRRGADNPAKIAIRRNTGEGIA